MPPFALQAPSVIGGDDPYGGVAPAANNLASVIANGGRNAAQAGYYGAQAGQAQAQTQAIQTQQAAKAQIPQAVEAARTGGAPELSSLSALLSQGGIPSDQQAEIYRGLAVTRSMVPGASTAERDILLTGPGGVAYSNTPSGQQEKETNDRAVAGIGAGATVGAAKVAAGASMANNRATLDQSNTWHQDEIIEVPNQADPTKVDRITRAEAVQRARRRR